MSLLFGLLGHGIQGPIKKKAYAVLSIAGSPHDGPFPPWGTDIRLIAIWTSKWFGKKNTRWSLWAPPGGQGRTAHGVGDYCAGLITM